MAKPRLVASLPISVTGQLPRPLGKTAALSLYWPRAWYEDCLLDEPQFIELWEQANATPVAQRTVAHHVVIKRQHQQLVWDTKPDAFIVAATLPPELAYWVGHWARNPAGVPKPIRKDEFGRLDLGDLNVWLWSRTVAPETYKGKFIAALWDIFLTIGR